jgi:hypothetical protein
MKDSEYYKITTRPPSPAYQSAHVSSNCFDKVAHGGAPRSRRSGGQRAGQAPWEAACEAGKQDLSRLR